MHEHFNSGPNSSKKDCYKMSFKSFFNSYCQTLSIHKIKIYVILFKILLYVELLLHSFKYFSFRRKL